MQSFRRPGAQDLFTAGWQNLLNGKEWNPMVSGRYFIKHLLDVNLAFRDENDSDKWSIFFRMVIGLEIKELLERKKTSYLKPEYIRQVYYFSLRSVTFPLGLLPFP